MTATLAQIQGTLASMQVTLGSLSRMSATVYSHEPLLNIFQEFNRLHGGGTGVGFVVVPFLDDTLPTVAVSIPPQHMDSPLMP